MIFEFNEFPLTSTSDYSAAATDVLSTTYGFEENGVTFTWSITDTVANNVIGYFPATGSDGALYAWAGGPSPSPPQDIFSFRPLNTDLRFTGTGASPIRLDFYTVLGQWSVTFHTAGGATVKQTFGNPAVTSVTTGGSESYLSSFNGFIEVTGVYSKITFTPSSQNADMTWDSLTANITCFVEGTLIETAHGPKPVEDLAASDLLRTPDGRLLPLRRVCRTRVDPSRMSAAAAPIRIRAGALGQGRPVRDLLLSPDHAVALDGRLVNASALVDGKTVTQERRTQPFTYYHIETDAHELILAEGVPAETYLEHLAPQSFDNADERGARVVTEMDLPRVTSGRLLPDALRPGRALA